MSTVTMELDEDLVTLVAQLTADQHQPIGEAAREMIVFELYRRGALSSGKAAQLLGLARYDFIQRASRMKISFSFLRKISRRNSAKASCSSCGQSPIPAHSSPSN